MLISQWTTDDFAPQDRWASVADALAQAIVPIQVSIDDPCGFEFHMASLDLDDGISVLRQQGSAHRSARGKRELARSDAHTYHFMVNLASDWFVTQRGAHRVAAGEGIVIDSAYVNELELTGAFEVIHVKMDERWLRRWLPEGVALAGRRFPLQQGFGAALNLFAAQMSPHQVKGAPLSAAALADKFGALMAMALGSCDASLGQAGLHDRILTVLAQRCAEQGLSAADVARDLHIGIDDVHAALAAHGKAFADVLTRLRCEAGLRMLRSLSFSGLSLDEISVRAGFADAKTMLRWLPPGASAYRAAGR